MRWKKDEETFNEGLKKEKLCGKQQRIIDLYLNLKRKKESFFKISDNFGGYFVSQKKWVGVGGCSPRLFNA